MLGVVGIDDVAPAEGVVEQHDATHAQVLLGPGQIRRVPDLVGVDEHEVERSVALDLAQPLERGPDVDARALGDARLLERDARHLGVLRLELEGVEAAVGHAAQETDARVAAERADLDGAAGAGGARQELEVQAVHASDGDGGQPGGDRALADLAQDVVLGVEHALGPTLELGAALTESLVRRRSGHSLSYLKTRAKKSSASGHSRGSPEMWSWSCASSAVSVTDGAPSAISSD